LLDDENVADKISRRLLQPASGKVSEHFSWGVMHSVVCSKRGDRNDFLSDMLSGGHFLLQCQIKDQVCQWLFDTYETQDPKLQLVVLRFLPILCRVYLPRVTARSGEPLSGIVSVFSCAFFFCFFFPPLVVK
jgi:hypothetical protein